MLKRATPVFSFKRGYQSLFEAIAKDYDVITGFNVGRIVRHRSSISIYQAGAQREPEHFDKVMLALPLGTAIDLFEGESDDGPRPVVARDIFKKLQYTDYYATIAESPTLFERAELHFTFGSQKLGLAGGHSSSQLWPDSKLRVFYHYGSPEDPSSVDAAVDNLKRNLADVGVTVGSVERTKHWRYFPRFSCDDIAVGCYDRVEKLQGKSNTYFLGSALAFETVEHTIGYSYQLVDREFPDQRSFC
ncbi:hypothetical protein F0Q45_26250 [Mycobacterium simiae]|uniref:Amine oxidase domain-containing protein n=1 Tax=Mycobacterium simiae TaxID=1784 RepID=A0A5B1B276_MYCSI|nr:hypothetical protein F0Q45_26250 [Mycobacterium simiae]